MANNINISSQSMLLNTAHKASSKPESVDNNQGAAVNRVEKSDRVSMTPGAAMLQNIEEKLTSVPDFNHAKVADIKAAIANGSFKIDPARVADKLLAFESGK